MLLRFELMKRDRVRGWGMEGSCLAGEDRGSCVMGGGAVSR